MQIVTREQWGAQPPKQIQARKLSDITGQRVHWQGAADHADHALCALLVRAIQRYHFSLGHFDIDYSYLVCRHGYVFQGRTIDVVPGATKNDNPKTIAYCVLGMTLTDEAWDALVAILTHDQTFLGRALDLATHREVEPAGYTVCPGDAIQAKVTDLRGGPRRVIDLRAKPALKPSADYLALEDDMLAVVQDDKTVYLSNGVAKRGIYTPADVDAWLRAGAVDLRGKVTAGDVKRMQTVGS